MEEDTKWATIWFYGTVLAMIISWSVNKSILWAIGHAFCGWFYVFYFAVNR